MSRREVPAREPVRLRRTGRERHLELWTEAAGDPPPVYGERWREFDGHAFRSFEPGRSKLAAALVRDWQGGVPASGERWLYLGAASGTTASHVADLVGPTGRVYALEKSPRPFARLLRLSDRWPNLLPILSDARSPESYFDLVPAVDGVYVDIAQADQVDIARRNAEVYLSHPGAPLVLALKTASMGRSRPPAAFLEQAESELERGFELDTSVRLDPFHRAHYLIGGRARPALFREETGAVLRPPPGRSPGRRRR